MKKRKLVLDKETVTVGFSRVDGDEGGTGGAILESLVGVSEKLCPKVVGGILSLISGWEFTRWYGSIRECHSQGCASNPCPSQGCPTDTCQVSMDVSCVTCAIGGCA